jgi:peptidoglycan-associated lipoprotein
MKQIWLALAVAALFAGCASDVKLDTVPVEDKVGKSVATTINTGAVGTGGTSATGVTAIDLGKSGPDALSVAGPGVVYFDYDSYVIKSEFQSVVEGQARYLRADPKRKAMLEGHTDERGGREYNLALGQRRAEAVGRALTLLGVAGSQVESVSFGKEKPAAAGQDESALARNRRVEVKYR